MPGRAKTSGSEGSRTLEKGLWLLEVLAGAGELSLSELARRAEVDTSTAYRLLESLRKKGFAERDEGRGFWRVGLKAYQIGMAYLEQGGLGAVAIPEMERLVVKLHETVNLAVLDAKDAVYIQQVEGTHLVRMNIRSGARAPLYCSGVGKILLAWKTPEEADKFLGSGPYKSYTPLTLTDLDSLRGELSRVRRQGYAMDNEEREPGVRCVAAPVRDWRGEVVAALSLSAPASRLSLESVPEVASQVLASANAISVRLGWNQTQAA